MKRILLSLLILQFFLPVVFIAGCVSAGKTGTLEKDNIKNENPKIAEEKERVKEEIRKLTGISEGKPLWFTTEPYKIYRDVDECCLEEVILKSFDFTKIGEITEGNTVVTLYFQKKDGKVDHLTLNIYDINSVFYTKEPFTDLEKRWGYKIAEAIRQRRLLIGMTEEQVMIIKGLPYKKKKCWSMGCARAMGI